MNAKAKPPAKAAAQTVAKPSAKTVAAQKSAPETPRILQKYAKEIVPAWMKKRGLKSALAVPRLAKITLNMGVGAAAHDKKLLTVAVEDLTRIAAQKPMTTRAGKSIAGFKLREGNAIGCKVTLRRRRMYEFFDRLVTIALPRSRDFRGLSARAFDGRGNYSLGIAEQIVFPEIHYEKIDAIRGLDVALTTTAAGDDEARELLSALGLPLR